jgi:quercetin dioxygenase-like cupin family protein
VSKVLLCTAALFLALATPPLLAVDFTPIALGQLPDGSWVEQYSVTFYAGESFPWHFHPGPLAIVVVQGDLTENRGCGAPLEVHHAGEAFTEAPGVVHEVVNNGTLPVILYISGILPPCYGDFNDAILVDAPRCNGKSGHARVEHVPDCP